QLPDPLVREVRIVDVTRNSQSYSLSTIFDEFIGKTLNDANLDKLESDISRFNKINNITTTSYSFTPYNKRSSSEGILYLYIRDWEKSPSRIAISLDGYFGFSNNPENYSWANTNLDIAGIFAKVNDTDLDASIDLSFKDVAKGTGKLYYNISSADKILIDGIAGLSISVGGISPVNSNYFKNRITSTGLQASISLGTQLQYASDLLFQSNIVYKISYLSPSTLPKELIYHLNNNDVAQIPYTDPFVSQLHFMLGSVYSVHDPSLFSTSGFLVNLNGMLGNDNNNFSYSGEFGVKYSYPINKQDTFKFNFNLSFRNSNPELLDSYYQLGGYRGMAGYANSQYRRGYMLIDLTYQKELGKFVGPIFLQSGIKFLTYDSYNPYDNLYSTAPPATLMHYPESSINIFEVADIGVYVGIGTKFNKASLVVGLGFSVDKKFALTIEFF
ncbi:MAG: hypothetical protein JJE21_05945, partial [Spirochaetaceae bacterium]|nr:hypothetical protein [Spirochaetaceae bacterium]